MITRIVRWAYLCAFLALLSLPASGQSAPSQSEWIKTLRDGGYVIIFRHGATYQDQADTDPLNPNNVLKQRQLNDEGRALAKSIGESLHKLRISCWPGLHQPVPAGDGHRRVDGFRRRQGLG